ncbi:MAG: hypothetical protein HY849_00395 [Nitrosomonadales bacterium]|nr:hypothetical protein [Nitrosomonadales bacterium]
MSGHTKEPWRVGCFHPVLGDIHETEIFDSEQFGDVIASTKTQPMHPAAPSNARRIVACVNACAGIDTETLEATIGLDELYSDIQRQRDELLAAAKSVVARWDTPLWKDVPATAEYIGQLRQAIAKAEGGVL